MAIDVSQLTDYAWSDIAKAAKHAMMASALGGATLTINGRALGRITIDEAKKMYDLAVAQMEAEQAGTSGTGNVLVNFVK